MALVLPVNLANIETWINHPGPPGVAPPDILTAATFLQTTVFPVTDHAQLQRISRQIMDQIEFAGIPGVFGYFALLNALLFLNPSTAPHVYQRFCNRAVEIDSVEIITYLQNLPPPPPPIEAQRDLIIQALTVESIQQHALPAVDRRPFLIRVLEQCRVGVGGGFGLPQWIQFAMTEAVNRANVDIIDELIMQYRNDAPLVQFLTNGIVESVVLNRFAELDDCFQWIGLPIPPDRQQAGGGPLIAATDPPILLRAAAYSLTAANLRAALIPANFVLVPRLLAFIVAIRNEIVNLTATSAWPGALAGIPGQYFDEVMDPAGNSTLPEKAARLGNLAVLQALIALPPLTPITYTRVSPTTGFTLLQTAMQNHNYDIAQAIWVANGNLYPAAWFPPGHVIDTGRRNTQINNTAFRTAFDNAYRAFNPGTVAPRGVAGLALGVKPTYGTLTPAQQLTAADGVVTLLNRGGDFMPNVGKNGPLGSAVLKQITTIRDELERITGPTAWDARLLIPLIARKGAIADGTLLPRANLLEVGIRLGANPNVADATGRSALHYVASYAVLGAAPRLTTPRSIIMLRTLLAAPLIDVNVAGPGGNTALHLMVGLANPSEEHLQLLMANSKLDYNLTNAAGDTPLIHFIKQHGPATGNPYHTLQPIMKLLLSKCDMTVIDVNRHTALWVAIDLAGNDAYLAKIVPDLAKGLTGAPPAGPVATERALALGRVPPAPMAAGTVQLPMTLAALTALNAVAALPPLPAWLPAEYAAVLNDTSVDASIRTEARQYVNDIHTYITGGPPSDADTLLATLSNSNFWWFLRNLRGVQIPVVGAVLPPFPIAATGNEAPTFEAHFADGTQYDVATPYRGAYRAGVTYTGAAAPTLPAGIAPADAALAQINNDVLHKLTGPTYITADPVRQRILKRLLNEMYYAQYNPALGNDLLTLLLHLRSKMDNLVKYQGIQTAKIAKAALLQLGSLMLAFINSIVPTVAPPALGFGFRFQSSVPLAIGAFPPVVFAGVSTVGARFAAAGAAAAGIMPIIPGLAAPLFVPALGGGLAAMVAAGIVPAPILINLFTGAPIDNTIVTSTYPVALTLGPDDALSHLPPPLGPITNVNGHLVNRSDTFYNFLQPFGLTTIKGGLAYILRPAELFVALFHKTPPQIFAIMQNRMEPFKVLLRDYCLTALIEFARFKVQPAVEADLRVARGKL